MAAGQAASAGPADDCVVDKIEEFEDELRNPATTPAEQLLALKFLMHFVGDVHQPLHASDHNDRGGNCIDLAPIPGVRSTNLHAFWDTGVLQALGSSPVDVAMRLEREITPAQVQLWSTGDVKAWAKGSFALAKSAAYNLPSLPTCQAHGTVTLSDAYQTAARQVAITQLEKAGIRMAYMLNQAVGQ